MARYHLSDQWKDLKPYARSYIRSEAKEVAYKVLEQMNFVGGTSGGGGGGGGGIGVHALSDTSVHTGTLASAQAPQFFLLDGTRPITGQFNITTGITQAPFTIHSDHYGQTITGFKADQLNKSVTAGDGLGGGGALTSNVTLNVLYKEGIELDSDYLRVDEDYAYVWTSLHEFNAGVNIDADSTLAGTLTFDGGAYTIDTAGAANLYLAPGGDLYLNPTGNVKVYSEDDIGTVTHGEGFGGIGWEISEKLSGGSPIAGKSHLDIRSIYAEELHTTAFIADTARVQVGETFVSNSMGLVAFGEDTDSTNGFTVPVEGGATKIWIENVPDLIGQVFANNDWVLLRFISRDEITEAWQTSWVYRNSDRVTHGGLWYGCKIDHTSSASDEPGSGGSWQTYWQILRSDTASTIANVWGQVTNYNEETSYPDVQSYTWTTRHGPGGYEAKPGSLLIGFGTSGASFIHTSAIAASAPWTKFRTWSAGVEPGPYAPANLTTHTQVGSLSDISDPDFGSLTGFGLYGTNVYLHGAFRTPDVVIDSSGMRIEVPDSAVLGDARRVMWVHDDGSGDYAGSVIGEWDSGGHVLHVQGTDQSYNNTVRVTASTAGSNAAQVELIADYTGGGQQQISMYEDSSSGYIEISSSNGDIRLWPTGIIDVDGDIIPADDDAYDIGSPTNEFDNLYVNNIVADTITGGTAMSGHTWQYDTGHMYVKSAGAETRWLYLVNDNGSYSMGLNVEGNIVVGGTVDGVNVANLSSTYTTHAADADAHHNRQHALDSSSDHTGSLPWASLSKTGSDLADLALRSHTDLTNISADDHHDPATAGDGLNITGQQLSVDVTDFIDTNYGLTESTNNIRVNLASPSGLEFSSGALAVDDSLAGNALNISSKVMDVLAGDGIDVSGGSVAVDLATPSGLDFSGGDLVVANSLAGNGLDISSKVMSVDETYAFNWSGIHTHSQELRTASMRPTLTDTYDIGTSLYWYRQQFVSRINAAIFAENVIQVIGGWFYVAKLQGTFEAAMLSSSLTADLGIDDTIAAVNDHIITRAHDAAGSVNVEYMKLTAYNGSNIWTVDRDVAFMSPLSAWVLGVHFHADSWQVGNSYVVGNVFDYRPYDGNIYRCILNHTAATSNEPFYGGSWPTYWVVDNSNDYTVGNEVKNDGLRYTCTVAHPADSTTEPGTGGSWASYWTNNAHPAWAEGTPWVLLGSTGDGRIELNANDTPRIQMVEQGAAYNSQTERLRIGDLKSTVDYGLTTKYGFAVGNNLGLTSTGGFSGITADEDGVNFYNTKLEMRNPGGAFVVELNESTGLSLLSGTNISGQDDRYITWYTQLGGSGNVVARLAAWSNVSQSRNVFDFTTFGTTGYEDVHVSIRSWSVGGKLSSFDLHSSDDGAGYQRIEYNAPTWDGTGGGHSFWGPVLMTGLTLDTVFPDANATLRLYGHHDNILQIDNYLAYANPYISWHQAGTRRMYIQYVNQFNSMRLANQYGPVNIWPGTGGSLTQVAKFFPSGILFDKYLHVEDNSTYIPLRVRSTNLYGSAITLEDYSAASGDRVKFIRSYDGMMTIGRATDGYSFVDDMTFYAGGAGIQSHQNFGVGAMPVGSSYWLNAASIYSTGAVRIDGQTIAYNLIEAYTAAETFRATSNSVTGSPYITFYQDTTRRAYIQFQDTDNLLHLRSEYGGVQLQAGTTSRLDMSNGEFKLEGATAGYLPYIAWHTAVGGGTRAAYLGWGGTTDKHLDWAFENGYRLDIQGGTVNFLASAPANFSGVLTANSNIRVSSGGYLELGSSANVYAAAPTIASSTTGWKIGLFSNNYAIGISDSTMALRTGAWLSFFNTTPTGTVLTGRGDTGSFFSCSPNYMYFWGSLGVWQTLSMDSDHWRNYGAGYHNAGYRRFGDRVELRGLIYNYGSSTYIGQMASSDYYPLAPKILGARSSISSGNPTNVHLAINTSGQISVSDSGDCNQWLSLDGLYFTR